MIPQRNLSLLSNRLSRGGSRRIPEAVLERDYCTAWFLVGLARTTLKDRLAFKGGTALKRCFFGDYRFSEDLDFTLIREAPFKVIRKELDLVFDEVRNASGITFSIAREDLAKHPNSHTFFMGYEGPLPAPRGGRQIKVDITIRERLVFPLVDRAILKGYDEYADLPPGAAVQVYSLEEIVVEKAVALSDRARNEPRDLFDIWYLTSGGHVDLADLKTEVEEKLSFRGRCSEGFYEEFCRKEARYRKLWGTRLDQQMAVLPGFDDVFRFVRRMLRRASFKT